MYSASSAGNCVREENILAVIWLRKGGEQILKQWMRQAETKAKKRKNEFLTFCK